MTWDEYRARLAAYRSVVYRRLLPAFVGVWALCFPGAVVTALALTHLGYQKLAVPVGLLVAVTFPLRLLLIDRMQRGLMATHGQLCPSCGKPLRDLSGQLAMTTGWCGNCGQRIIEDA